MLVIGELINVMGDGGRIMIVFHFIMIMYTFHHGSFKLNVDAAVFWWLEAPGNRCGCA